MVHMTEQCMRISKYICKIIFLSIMLFLFSIPAVGAESISVYIDGQPVVFTADLGIHFVDSNYRTLVPLRVTMEAAGCNISWNQATSTATLTKGDAIVTVTIGQNYITKSGERIVIDTKAIEKQNRIYLPIRAVLETFGANIEYSNNLINAKFPTSQILATEEYLIASYFDSYIDNETYALSDISKGLDNYTYKDDYFREAKSFWKANEKIIHNILTECGNDYAGTEIKKVFIILNEYNMRLLASKDFEEALNLITNFSHEQLELEKYVLDILKNM